MTADNGTEFGEASDLEAWGTRVYFAHPNERHNALLRRFLPKGTALDPYTTDDLFLIADEINRLPRRQLDYRTPDELFENEMDNNIGMVRIYENCSSPTQTRIDCGVSVLFSIDDIASLPEAPQKARGSDNTHQSKHLAIPSPVNHSPGGLFRSASLTKQIVEQKMGL